MRLFIAINFDEPTRRNICAVQERLRAAGSGNFTHPENLHLTLAFLGETAPGRVAAVRRAMEQSAPPPLRLLFDRVGRFQRDGGDIWWIGLADNPPLLRLQGALCQNLAAQGFTLEDRRFSPHITLAREVRLTAPPDRRALLGEPFAAEADAISLMLSERIGAKLQYSELFKTGGG